MPLLKYHMNISIHLKNLSFIDLSFVKYCQNRLSGGRLGYFQT